MIATGGSEFRTLTQPIFVNGKKVREVWANGRMVYPEIGWGNYVKVRGILAISKSFTRPQVGGLFKDTIPSSSYLIQGGGTYIPEWNSFFAVKVVFVAIYKYGGSNIEIVDDWLPLTTQRYQGGSYASRLNPLAPGGEDDSSGAIDTIYGKRIAGSFTLKDFRCEVLYDGIPIPPMMVEEIKQGGDIIIQYPNAYTRIDTIPDMPSALDATLWNMETFSELGVYPNPMNPEVKLRISQHESGGIVLAMDGGLTVPATKYYYGGTYFYDGNYSLYKTERVTLEISRVYTICTLQVPITEILYQGMESDAPDWAKTITDGDLNV